MDAVYTTEALSTGAGRDGRSVVKDSDLDFTMTAPKEMGGSGEGANPEQLFAAGYAACYHSALKAVAKDKDVDVENSSVGARVNLGKNDEGFYLGVDLEVTIPGVEDDKAQELADAAHQMCPYSKATPRQHRSQRWCCTGLISSPLAPHYSIAVVRGLICFGHRTHRAPRHPPDRAVIDPWDAQCLGSA